MGASTPRGDAVLVLTGPTTSGKTALSVELARRWGGEIVSADSRQVYRGMDIGTDKASLKARGAVPHFGLDLVDPGDRYSAGRFNADATRWIRGILRRGHIPIVAGGTGFFVKSLREPLFDEPPMDSDRRRALGALVDALDTDVLESAVRILDPERADLAAAGGRQRMARTIEVALLTGVPLSAWHRKRPPHPTPFRFVTVVLELPRDELDRRIDARVSRMVERGFLAEVERLLAAGHDAGTPGMTGTGYREVARYLQGGCTLDEALDTMRLQTRQYARRQLTWFRHQLSGARSVDAGATLGEQVLAIERIWGEAHA